MCRTRKWAEVRSPLRMCSRDSRVGCSCRAAMEDVRAGWRPRGEGDGSTGAGVCGGRREVMIDL